MLDGIPPIGGLAAARRMRMKKSGCKIFALASRGVFLTIAGSLAVIPTPFYENRIDYSSLERLFGHIFPDLEGYTLCGSTGEAVSLSLSERIELAQFAVQPHAHRANRSWSVWRTPTSRR